MPFTFTLQFLVNEAVTGNWAEVLLMSFALQIRGRVLSFSVLKCLLPDISSSCSRAIDLQMLLYKIWNYVNINAWCLECQNYKGASKNGHTLSCLLCTGTLCYVTFAWIWDTSYTERMSPSWLLKYWQFLFCINKHRWLFAIECITASLVLWARQVLKIRCTGFAFIIHCCFSWQAESLLSFWLQYFWMPEESLFGCIWIPSTSFV